mmetsp:Transcript_55441/g.154485  ORF Transcript_55441/g.154485 Transcript_55441/m.154485 type:complete len:274 (+) Transcript_55441:550-1371(+)
MFLVSFQHLVRLRGHCMVGHAEFLVGELIVEGYNKLSQLAMEVAVGEARVRRQPQFVNVPPEGRATREVVPRGDQVHETHERLAAVAIARVAQRPHFAKRLEGKDSVHAIQPSKNGMGAELGQAVWPNDLLQRQPEKCVAGGLRSEGFDRCAPSLAKAFDLRAHVGHELVAVPVTTVPPPLGRNRRPARLREPRLNKATLNGTSVAPLANVLIICLVVVDESSANALGDSTILQFYDARAQARNHLAPQQLPKLNQAHRIGTPSYIEGLVVQP